MKKFKLMQIIPELQSGGVEQGTLDVANFLGKNNYENIIVSNGGKLLNFDELGAYTRKSALFSISLYSVEASPASICSHAYTKESPSLSIAPPDSSKGVPAGIT